MSKFDNFIYGVCRVVELGSILGIAAIALKRNNDCYKAECKRIDAEYELAMSQLDVCTKDLEIMLLKKEIEKLKGDNESEEVEA